MKTALFTIIGFAYGIILLVLGFLAAGCGHGVFIPLRVFSSPVCEIINAVIPPTPENQTLAMIFLLAMVLLWGCAGLLSAFLARHWARTALVVLLAVHYAAFPLIYFDGDWGYFPRVWENMPVIVVMGFSLYLLGQAALWFLLIRSFLSARRVD
jgi:hypothetical protein